MPAAIREKPPAPKRKRASVTRKTAPSVADSTAATTPVLSPACEPSPSPGAVTASPWILRPYQEQARAKFDQGVRRQLLIWHRRAGKDVFGLDTARQEAQRRVGGYWHFFPKHVQARRAIWNGVDPKKGRKFIDLAFGDLLAHQNNTEMFLELMNGSTWQLLGSDNYDRIVGGNACGVVFSEWALCDPKAWDFMRPIIRENNGWALFITTYRGRNHAWQMAQRLKDSPDWHVDVRTVEDTQDNLGRRIITAEDIAAERADGMSEALIQQEYFCDPEAAVDGAIYAPQLARLRKDQARMQAAWNPARPVLAAWNLADMPVSGSVVFLQPGERPSILAANTWHFESLGEVLAHVREYPWPVHTHLLREHDDVLLARLEPFGIYPEVLPESLQDAPEIDSQTFLDSAQIAPDRCERLLDSLAGYRREESRDSAPDEVDYSDDYAETWHRHLVYALEAGAAWLQQDLYKPWQPGQHYRNHDRRMSRA